MIGNTFSCQKELPLMPVPDLNTTCRKLIEWAEPLLTQQESTKTREVIEKFLQPGGEGERLQNELIEWAQPPSVLNWFAPVWRDFYLACPQSLVINSNVLHYREQIIEKGLIPPRKRLSNTANNIFRAIKNLAGWPLPKTFP